MVARSCGLVEQNIANPLAIAEWAYVVVDRRVVCEASADTLSAETVADLYFHGPAAKSGAT